MNDPGVCKILIHVLQPRGKWDRSTPVEKVHGIVGTTVFQVGPRKTFLINRLGGVDEMNQRGTYNM